MKPTCPFCKGHDVAEMDTVLVLAGVKAIHPYGDILEFDGESVVDWDTSEPIKARNQYECQDCHREFSLKQLQQASLKALPKWLRRWLKQGDDMRCPQCK